LALHGKGGPARRKCKAARTVVSTTGNGAVGLVAEGARAWHCWSVFVTNHVLSGVLIGQALRGRPATAFAAGVASHLALDAAPHWGCDLREPGGSERFLRFARRDGVLGLCAMSVAIAIVDRRTRLATIAAMVGAVALDLDKPMDPAELVHTAVVDGVVEAPTADERDAVPAPGDLTVALCTRERPDALKFNRPTSTGWSTATCWSTGWTTSTWRAAPRSSRRVRTTRRS